MSAQQQKTRWLEVVAAPIASGLTVSLIIALMGMVWSQSATQSELRGMITHQTEEIRQLRQAIQRLEGFHFEQQHRRGGE